MGEEIRVGGRVRARRAADRALVDLDHLVEDLDAVDALVLAGPHPHPRELVRERLVDDLVHERRLARAGHTGDRDELADREVDVDPLQVVLGGAEHGEPAVVLGAALRDGDRPRAGEELARDRLLVALHLRGGALGDHMAAVLAGAGPHVDEPVGDPHHLLVVLDDDHGVAEVAQTLERADQLVVVALVQADRRLVEDVEHADELRADLRREAQALGLATGQRRGGAVELQVPHPDVVEEGQPLADLLDDAMTDQLLGLGQAERIEELERAGDREPRELVDVDLADGHGEHLRLEPRALADRARPERHVLLDPLALRARVGLAVAPLERRDDPLEVDHVRTPAAHPVAVLDVHLVAAGAVEEVVLLLGGQLLPRQVGGDLVAVGDRLDHRLVEP